MKIADLELIPIATRRDVLGDGQPTAAPGSRHTVLRLVADDGLTGWGEMPDWGHPPRMMPDLPGLTQSLKTLLVGRDPFDITGIATALRAAFPDESYLYSMSSLVRCGVDLGVHDLAARALGRPVHDLLGGRVRDAIPVCYPLFRMRGPQQIPERLQTVRNRLAQGFDLFRIYVGGDVDADDELLTAIAAEFGGRVRIKSLDFSGVLPWKDTVRAYQRLSRHEFMLVESGAPKSDIEGMRQVRDRIGHPLSEHIYSFVQARSLAEARAVDIFNIAVPFIHGLTGARKLFHLAEVFDIGTLIGTTQELDISTAAQAHLGASVANLDYPCDITGAALYHDFVVRERLRYEAGALQVPTGPGLGVDVDEERLAACRRELTA